MKKAIAATAVLPMRILVVVVMVRSVIEKSVKDEAVAVAGRPTPLIDSLPKLAVSEAGIACAGCAANKAAKPVPAITPRVCKDSRMTLMPRSMARETVA